MAFKGMGTKNAQLEAECSGVHQVFAIRESSHDNVCPSDSFYAKGLVVHERIRSVKIAETSLLGALL